MTPQRRAVFLDRDGVLNRVVWRDGKPASPRSLAELEIAPEAAQALALLKALGFALYVVTNQPDVARGRMARSCLDQMHDALGAVLPLDGIAVCAHDDIHACDCRKPKPGLLLTLAERHGIDLRRSWMVGDQDRDVACGRAAGCATVLIAASYNTGAGADYVVGDLRHAVCVVAKETSARAAQPFQTETRHVR